MRTRSSTVTFKHPFTLNRNLGELPPGTYDIEIDEEEIQATDRTAYRRVAIYFYVQNSASTRTITVTPADLESATTRDLMSALRQADADADERAVGGGRVA
jgi:hypothetical protein